MTEGVEAIAQAARHFLRVFDDQDWEPFVECWSADPTAFFPFQDAPQRADGRNDVLSRFRQMFDQVRSSQSGPPYLHLVPRELNVRRYGDAGLVTFMLGQPPGPPLARRTALFVLEGGSWKLAHLHASNVRGTT